MSTMINVHGPYQYGVKHHPQSGTSGSEHVQFRIADPINVVVVLYLDTRADCDELIYAARAAKDLLPEVTP